jgi:hypothetical protein
MHMQKKWVGVLFSLLFTLLLAACSSGGGDSAAPVVPAPVVPAGTAEGLWTGTLVDESTSDTRTVKGAVLDDGTYWFLYSAVGTPALMAGALQGDSSTQNGTFASLNGQDFNNELALILPRSVTAHYVMEDNLTGTVTYPGGKALTFTSTFDTEYNVVPVFANVAGTYEGSVFDFPHTITISNLGVVTVTTAVGPQSSPSGIELGCDFTGTLSTRSQGNVYNISFTPSPACIISTLLGRTFTGVAFFDADPAPTKMYVLALHRRSSPFYDYVFPFTGTKP